VSGLCILAAAGVIATLPHAEFTLAWTHSVHKVRWEERYVVDGNVLRLVHATAEGHGAGLEIPEGATHDGRRWAWRPDREVASLKLAHSLFGGDYRVCTAGGCKALAEIAPRAGAVTLKACDAAAGSRGG
jgi:hypothetical protein